MRLRYIFLIIFTIINTGLLHAEQEAPVVTKALRDTIQERLKLVRRYSSNLRSTDFKLARIHMERVMYLTDSLHLTEADYLTAAGDLEHQAFTFERNKPASGGKTDMVACLTFAKQCYLYYQRAFLLYQAQPERYAKNGVKQQQRIRQLALQYYLLTNGFQANAAQSYKGGDLVTTREEFILMLDGAQSAFLNETYQADTKRFADFAKYLTDSIQCHALYNCATLSSALGQMDSALTYYDSLKVRQYEPDRVFRNIVSIHSSRADTVRLIDELHEAISCMPDSIWYQKNLLQIYLDLQQWTEAEQMAEQCYATDSTDAQTLAVRGQLYEMRGDVPRAMASYLRSYAQDSTQANVCSYIGRIYYNRAVNVHQSLYNQRRFKQIDAQVQPIYDQALPWYDRAFTYDTVRADMSVPKAIREIMYSRFTKVNCPNKNRLIARYNEVSQAYGLELFGR